MGILGKAKKAVKKTVKKTKSGVMSATTSVGRQVPGYGTYAQQIDKLKKSGKGK